MANDSNRPTPARSPRAETPAPTPSSRTPAQKSEPDAIAAFLSAAKAAAPAPDGKRGRLIFALDATMSRQPTWDRAQRLQAEMFTEAGKVGGLDVQLIYFRGFGECRASRFVSDARALADIMTGIECRGGRTQIGKVLSHALKTTRAEKVAALVYVGDAMEEGIDQLTHRAGELGLLGVKAFVFQEGRDPLAAQAFREIARLTGGAYFQLDEGAAANLGKLLAAVAAYAAGGRAALADLGKRERSAQRLLEQLR